MPPEARLVTAVREKSHRCSLDSVFMVSEIGGTVLASILSLPSSERAWRIHYRLLFPLSIFRFARFRIAKAETAQTPACRVYRYTTNENDRAGNLSPLGSGSKLGARVLKISASRSFQTAALLPQHTRISNALSWAPRTRRSGTMLYAARSPLLAWRRLRLVQHEVVFGLALLTGIVHRGSHELFFGSQKLQRWSTYPRRKPNELDFAVDIRACL